METAIEIRDVNKQYKQVHAVRNLSLKVPSGKVYGLLGENGAGKTTTLRMVTGLIYPNSGSIFIYGEKVRTGNPRTMKNVGAIIESPSLYRNLSAVENIQIAGQLHNGKARSADQILEMVGLQNQAKKRVRHFSTGMKQRLSIGCALVHSPKILILDEPMHGLDPQGVIDLRKLIRELAQNLEITVLISSHILSEIEQIADLVGIIHQGELVEQFDLADLAKQEQDYLLLEVDNTEKSRAILSQSPWVFDCIENRVVVRCPSRENSLVNEQLLQHGVKVFSMKSVRNTLEQRFLQATGDENGTKE